MDERSILGQVWSEGYMAGLGTAAGMAADDRAAEWARVHLVHEEERNRWAAVGFLAGITVATFVNWLVL